MMAPEFHRVEWFLAARHEISSPRYIVTFALSSPPLIPFRLHPFPSSAPSAQIDFRRPCIRWQKLHFVIRNGRDTSMNISIPSINNPVFNSCVLFGSLFFLVFLSFILSLLFFSPFFPTPRSKQERCDFAFINNPVCAIAFFPFANSRVGILTFTV